MTPESKSWASMDVRCRDRVRTDQRAGEGRVSRPIFDAGGFTLVEVLVALVIAGVVGAGVIGLLLNQNEFYGQTDDMVFAEQSLRGSVDLLATELRMASSDDIVQQTTSAVTFRFDRARAIVCSDQTTSGPIHLYVFDAVSAPNVSGTVTTEFSNPGSNSWTAISGFDPLATGSNSSTAQAVCEAGGDPVNMPNNVRFYYEIPDGNWSGTEPEQGAVVTVSQPVKYRFAPSSFTSGLALWRENQELAAPFDNGARFEYVTSGGSVTAVRMVATAIGDGNNRYDVSRQLDYTIPLRN